MIQITRKLEWDSGHRVVGHGGKCRHLHGHRYTAEITVKSAELNDLGMVVDFSAIKSEVGNWVDIMWDHNMILNPADALLDLPPTSAIWGTYYSSHEQKTIPKKPYIMPDEAANPTAENMSRVLAIVAQHLLTPFKIEVEMVRLYETPNCWADYIVPSADGLRLRVNELLGPLFRPM